MDINELFEGIAGAFRHYQAEMAEQEQTSTNPAPTGVEPCQWAREIEPFMVIKNEPHRLNL